MKETWEFDQVLKIDLELNANGSANKRDEFAIKKGSENNLELRDFQRITTVQN